MSEQHLPSIECEHCGGMNNPFADTCWVCFYPLSGKVVPYNYVQQKPAMSVGRILGIVFGSILAALTFLAAIVIVMFFACIAVISSATT